MRDEDKWDGFYLDIAHHYAVMSKDTSTKVGAVIVSPHNRLVAAGYNGFPPGVADDHRLQIREMKYEIIIHGEVNALLSAERSVRGCTLYTTPFLPCSRCASIMIAAGIVRVVAPRNTVARWEGNLEVARGLFREAGVVVKEG
jgi:dCMP deaminase